MEQNCIFCKIARHEIPSQIVFEDEDVVAFKDVKPVAPVHIVIIPKEHISGVMAITEENGDILTKIFLAAKRLAQETGIDKTGFRVVVNHGREAGQSVFHLHFHLLGGRPLSWPPG
ncbi:MAG TPA: histidine triad nucleotide-binding protein [Armatimonadota bacterium]|nr:histidine triad nucleotide-binding protein [Armatimonadota bacterium]